MTRQAPPKKRLCVLVEGKTEEAYIQEFAKCNPLIKVIIVAVDSSRPKLVKKAVEYSKKNGLDTWIIDKLSEAKKIYAQVEEFNKKHKAQINIIYSVPCIEVWFLIHFVKADNVPCSAKQVQKNLGQYLNYDHGKHPIPDIDKLEPGYDQAVQTAKKWKESLGDTPEYEASLFTGMYKLTEFIKKQ